MSQVLDRRRFVAAASVAGAASLIGQRSIIAQDSVGTAAADATPAASFPLEVTTAAGTTVVPAVAERVAALSFPDVDTTIALGVIPVVMQRDGYTESGISEWFDGAVAPEDVTFIERGSDYTMPVEELIEIAPDLILDTLGSATMAGFEQLNQFVPTISGPELTWTNELADRTRLIGTLLGKSAEAEAALADADARIDQVAVDYPNLDGLTFSYAYVRSLENIGAISDPNYFSVTLFGRWGMSVTPTLLTDDLKDDPAPGGVTLSWENINLLDADAMFIGFVSPDLQEQFEASEIFSTLTAVQNGNYFPLTPEFTVALQVPSIANIPWAIEQMNPFFEKLNGDA